MKDTYDQLKAQLEKFCTFAAPTKPDSTGAAMVNVRMALIDQTQALLKAAQDLPPATDAEIERARRLYGTEAVQIDNDAVTSRTDGGVWVSAWLYLADSD